MRYLLHIVISAVVLLSCKGGTISNVENPVTQFSNNSPLFRFSDIESYLFSQVDSFNFTEIRTSENFGNAFIKISNKDHQFNTVQVFQINLDNDDSFMWVIAHNSNYIDASRIIYPDHYATVLFESNTNDYLDGYAFVYLYDNDIIYRGAIRKQSSLRIQLNRLFFEFTNEVFKISQYLMNDYVDRGEVLSSGSISTLLQDIQRFD